MKSASRHIDLLDQLRGMAILAVLVIHTLGATFGYDTLPWKGWFRDFAGPANFLWFLPLNFAQAGVPVFFVVSGFCIHLSFQQQGRRWGEFFIRRFFRIYPAYLAALFFFVLLAVGAEGWSNLQTREAGKQILTHLFMVHNFDATTLLGVNPAFWSLAVEVQLYLLYPVLLFLAGKTGWRRALAWLLIIELAIRGGESLVLTTGAEGTVWGQLSFLLTWSPLGFWFSWAIGAAIAESFLKLEPLPFLQQSMVWWLGAAGVSYFIKPLYPFRFLLFAMLASVLLSRFLSRTQPSNAPHVFSSGLKRIGVWSYSLYLLHQPLLQILSPVMKAFVPRAYLSAPAVFLFFMATWVVAIIPFSGLWYYGFELPAIALGKKLAGKLNRRLLPGGSPDQAVATAGVRARPRGLIMAALAMMVAGTFWAGAKFAPLSPGENNNRAWALATDPDAARRNGDLAVTLAEDACNQTHYQNTVMIGTLAAAYAEAGRFDSAILAVKKACDLAAQNGETNLLKRNQELLVLYQNHQPYHEPAPPLP